MGDISTRAMAEKWACKPEWIRERCLEGMIPLAEKRNNKKWYIPEEAEKPPCTGTKATVILENLLEANKGNRVILFPPSLENTGPSIIQFLSKYGFISETIPGQDPCNVVVLERGIRLISTIRKKPVEEITKSIKTQIGVKIGPIHMSAEHSSEKKVG